MRHYIISTDNPKEMKSLSIGARGLGEKLTEEDRKAFDELKELQEVFQEKYCPNCRMYDPFKKDFIEKSELRGGIQFDEENCVAFATDLAGECHNYKPRNLEELQEEFQKRYCPKCVRYDIVHGCFKEKGVNNPDDCLFNRPNWEGECDLYEQRKEMN